MIINVKTLLIHLLKKTINLVSISKKYKNKKFNFFYNNNKKIFKI